MDVNNFLNSIYLGDRYCTKMILDGSKNQIELHINRISRIRGDSRTWDFYSDEDIENGAIIFHGVQNFYFGNSALIPNDEIYDISLINKIGKLYEFSIDAAHVDDNGVYHEVTIKIICEGIYLMDPAIPDRKIVD